MKQYVTARQLDAFIYPIVGCDDYTSFWINDDVKVLVYDVQETDQPMYAVYIVVDDDEIYTIGRFSFCYNEDYEACADAINKQLSSLEMP